MEEKRRFGNWALKNYSRLYLENRTTTTENSHDLSRSYKTFFLKTKYYVKKCKILAVLDVKNIQASEKCHTKPLLSTYIVWPVSDQQSVFCNTVSAKDNGYIELYLSHLSVSKLGLMMDYFYRYVAIF